MTRKFTFTILAMLFAILGPGAEAWGQTVTWTRVTTVKELTDGGTFIMGYEATAKSGIIVPLRSKDCNATTSANGYFNTGITAGSSTNGTIDMSKVTETADYEVYITSPASGKINIQMKDAEGNFYGATSGGTTSNKGRLYTSGNSAETNLTPEFSSETNNQFKLTGAVTGQYKYLKYNTSSPRFAFYNSAGSNIVFYKKDSGDTPSAELVSIAISGNPDKTTYEAGEEFDPAGLVVTGTYDDGSEETITSGITWEISPSGALTAGTTSVTVKATVDGKSDTKNYDVTVTEHIQTYANTYTSNVELTTTGGTSASVAKVKWKDVEYNALKCGTGSSAGKCVVTIPAATKTLHFHAAGWNGETVTLNGTFNLTADAGVAGNSPFTLQNDPETKDYFTLDPQGATSITFSATFGKRFVIFGVNFEADTEPSITADVEAIEFEQKELDGTVTDSKTISATGKNLTAPITASMKDGSAAVFSVVANGTPTAAAGEFTVSYSTTEAGEYAGTVVLSSGETSLEIPVSAKVVAHIPVLQSVAVSGTPDKTEYTEGDAFETAGLVVTGTYDVGDPQIITEGIEWTVTPSGALAANVTSVSVVATVDGVASEAFNVNITVVELPKWAKVTADKTDWSGEYLLVYEGTGDNAGTAYVWTGVDAANCNATATISNNQITKPADAVSLTIAAMDGGYSILVNGGDNNGKYISGKSGNNTVNFGTTASANTLAYSNGNVTITSNTSTIMYNSNSSDNRFRYYKSGSSQKAVQLYEKVLPPTNEAVTFAAPEGGSLVIKNGENPIESGTTIQNGTVLDVTFGMTPAEAYKDVAIKVTKTDGGDDVTSTVYDATKKQITMPRYAITVAVTFTKLYKISLVTAGEGTGSATMNGVTTDIYVDDETRINLVANAVAPNEFTKWSATDNISIDAENDAETYAYAFGDGTITATFGISALQPLGTPTLSNPTNITYSGVTLNWEELANAEAYNVELLLNDETVASDVITGATSWTPEVTLQANTTYTYTVQGVGDGITYAIDNNPKATSSFTTDDYPAVVLTLSENGFTSTKNGKLNTPITLPTTSTQACDGKVFVGWSATTIDGETDAEPSLLGETYTFTNPEQLTATIYAVYAKETPGEAQTVFSENFDACTGTGGNDDQWSGSIANTTLPESITGWIFTKEYAADHCAKFGTSSAAGSAKTPAIEFTGKATLTFRAGAWSGDAKTLNITTTSGTATPASVTLIDAAFTSYEIVITGATENPQITFAAAQASKNRFFLDDVVVKTAGAPTYSNYCTTAPIVISENTVWDGNVTINGNTTVTIGSDAVLTVNGILTNTNAAKLIIEDGGQLIVNNAGLQATMKKNITGTEWYTISSPLAANTEFKNVTNLIPSSGVTDTDYDLYRFDEANAKWINSRIYENEGDPTSAIIANLAFTTIDKGVGYIYANNAGEDHIAFAGEVNVAPAECTLTNGAAHGFNLIGNPFTQNIKLANVTGVDLADGFYVLTDQNTWGAKIETGSIAPLQGFLVQVDGETGGTATIEKPAAPSKGERSNEQNTNIEIIVSNGSYRDNAYAMFGEGIGLNKVNHRNAEAPMLYVPQDGEDFAIAFMDENTTVFPVSFKAMTTGNYSIRLKATDDVSTLVLVDNMTGTETNMLLEDSYTFIGSPADNENRFTVKLTISHNDGQSDSEHFAYQNGSELVVNGEGTLQIFDVLGRVVISEEVHGQTVNVGGLNTGAYIVRLTGESVKTQKIVVR